MANLPNQPSENVTAAGSKRPMVPANYSKMSDEQLLQHYEGAKAAYQHQLKIDPTGKGFLGTTKQTLESVENQLRSRRNTS